MPQPTAFSLIAKLSRYWTLGWVVERWFRCRFDANQSPAKAELSSGNSAALEFMRQRLCVCCSSSVRAFLDLIATLCHHSRHIPQ